MQTYDMTGVRPDARSTREPLQPTLLDRLTEAAPPSRAGSEPIPWIDAVTWRETVLRDLAWLLNTTCALDGAQQARYGEAAQSVVNYGITPLAGTCMSEIDARGLEEILRLAIVRFEPRLLPESVEVRCIADPAQGGGRHNVLTFEIAASLWGPSSPTPMLIRTDLDLESGVASLRALAER